MCGICGLCNSDNIKDDINYMLLSIQHRGPDASGFYIDEKTNLALGHTRLSILDLSSAGNQPMISQNQRLVISLNGEIYNYTSLKKRLPDEIKRKMKSTCDTEVVLESFANIGIDNTLNMIRGMFAIALYDREERKLYLMRDRAGEKPLYYGFVNGMLIFGSELKSIQCILKKMNVSLDINLDAVGMFLRHSYIPAPYTIYKNLWKVEAAQIIVFDFPFITITEKKYYWKLENVKIIQGTTINEAKNHVMELLNSAVAEQMVADVPYGAFLSGGIDSSLIVAYMRKHSVQRIKTFSIGFESDVYNEANHAKRVAKYLECDHHELYISDQEARDIIPELMYVFDEPYADSSQIPTYFVSKLAKQKVTVALTGDAGDEIFCGYEHYWLNNAYKHKILSLPLFLRKFGNYILKSGIFEKLNDLTYNNKIDKLSRLLISDSDTCFFYEMLKIDTAHEAIIKNGFTEDYFLKLENRLPYKDFIANMQYIDFITYLQNDILVKVDRSSMYHSLETRVPFLDKRIVEYVYGLPVNFKYEKGESKKILRSLLYDEVPKSLIDRPKQGFGIPLDDWLRGPLFEWANDLLYGDNLKAVPGINHKQILDIWRKHIFKDENYKTIIWNVLMLSQWLNNNTGYYNFE